MYPVEFSCQQSIVVLILSRWLLGNLSPRGVNVVTTYTIQAVLTDQVKPDHLKVLQVFKWPSFQAFKATLTWMTENRQTHLMIIKSCQCTFCILQLSLFLVT